MKEFFNSQNIIKAIKKIGPIIGIILLFYLIYTIGIDKISGTFMKISPVYILIAILLTIPGLLLKNYQWQLILKKQNINVSFLKSLKLILIGRFYGAITPGGIGSYMKILHLKDEVKQPLGKLFVNNVILGKVSMVPYYFIIIIGTLFLVDKAPSLLPYVLISIAMMILPTLLFIKKERGEKILNTLIRLFTPKKSRPNFNNLLKLFIMIFQK